MVILLKKVYLKKGYLLSGTSLKGKNLPPRSKFFPLREVPVSEGVWCAAKETKLTTVVSTGRNGRKSTIKKTRLVKYIENFTSKIWKISDKNSDIFLLKTYIVGAR